MADSDSKPYGVIYCVRHVATGRVYIGQTTKSAKQRWAEHTTVSSYCVRLSRAIQKYGADAFTVEEICNASSKEDLDKKEIFYINLYDSINRAKGFNLREGGSFGKHCEESKKKMSVKVRKAYENPELRARISALKKGKKRSNEYIAKASARMTGTRLTEETKVKLSRIVMATWESEEYRRKVSDGQSAARSDAGYLQRVAENTCTQWQAEGARSRLVKAQTAGKLAMWADPERKAAFLEKRRATIAAKKAAQI